MWQIAYFSLFTNENTLNLKVDILLFFYGGQISGQWNEHKYFVDNRANERQFQT